MKKTEEKLRNWREVKKNLDENVTTIYLLTSFTANTIEKYLGYDLYESGETYKIEFGPYNQIQNQCMDQNSRLYQQDVAYTVIWPRIEDVTDVSRLCKEKSVNECLNDFKALIGYILQALEKIPGKIIFVIPAECRYRPAGLGDLQSVGGISYLASKIRLLCMEILTGRDKILLCDSEEALRITGSLQSYDDRLYSFAKIPYTDMFFKNIALKISDVVRMTKNNETVLMIDAGLLLDGKESDDYRKIRKLDDLSFRAGDSLDIFRKYLKMAENWGTKLLVYTGASEEHARSVFASGGVDFLGSIDYLLTDCQSVTDVFRKISSAQNEDQNRRFVLISSMENEEMSADNFTSVVLPDDIALWCQAIDDSGVLCHIPQTVRSVEQTVSGSVTETEESNTEECAIDSNIEDFYKSLKLRVSMEQVGPDQCSQLNHILLDFNEFCLTDFHVDSALIDEELKEEDSYWYGIYVKDRFGDYGMAGLLIGRKKDEQFEIQSFQLSCRVLGKQTEYHVMQLLADKMHELGTKTLKIGYSDNGFNDEMVEWLAGFLQKSKGEIKSGHFFVISRDELIRLTSTKLNTGADTAAEDETDNGSASENSLVFLKNSWNSKKEEFRTGWIRYMQECRNVMELMDKLDKFRYGLNVANRAEYVAPRTHTEKKLVDLWESILHIDHISVKDNFFAIGGSSILATQLVVKFEEVFGIQLPIRIFVDKSSIEQMAMHIDAMSKGEDWNDQNERARNSYRYHMRRFLKSEIAFDESITWEGMEKPLSPSECKNVLLTGATGFLGAHILANLLERTPYTVYCLVRAEDESKGAERIFANLKNYELYKDIYRDRIRIICGDISKPNLGLNSIQYSKYAGEIDMIYHCAANTNFVEPYEVLKPVNVGGTQEVLRFASTVKSKIIQHVSTSYVYSTLSNPYGFLIKEDTLPDSNETLILGYQQTKMVAEQMIGIARERGLSANIYRVGRISPSGQTGIGQPHDLIWMMIKASLESKMMFEDVESVDLVPVDFVSEALVEISQNEAMLNHNFHLVCRHRTKMTDLYQWMNNRGYHAELLPYKDWKRKLIELVRLHPELEGVRSIVPLLSDNITAMKETIFYDMGNVDKGIREKNVSSPEITEATFNKYLDYFIKSGFFIEPEEQ